MERETKEKKRKTGRTVLLIAILLLFAVFVFSSAMIVKNLLDTNRAKNEVSELKDLIAADETEAETLPEKTEAETEPEEPGETETEETRPTESVTDVVAEKGFDGHAYLKYGALYERNPDFIGWLLIEGTRVDYPVLFHPEEAEYYLYRNFDRADSTHGLPFLDERSTFDREKTSANLIIYAHHKTDGTMFRDLTEYEKRSYYEKHRYIRFETLYGTRVYEVIGAFKINVDRDLFFYHNYIDLTEEMFNEYIQNVNARRFYATDQTAHYGDELLTLSTCEYSFDNGRFVVVAKRIE